MGSGRYTAVPSIDGLTKDTAVTALQDAGLSPTSRVSTPTPNPSTR